MANLKFSDFTAYATTPVTATSGLVAYEGTTNIQFTPAQLAPFTGIYAANGTIGTTRKALITDTIQFRNAGDTSDIFIMNTDGTFALGDGATSLSNTNVIIGKGAKDNQASNTESVVIGNAAQIYNDVNQDDCVAVGDSSNVRHEGVAVGSASNHYGTKAVSVGYQSSAADNGISIGNLSGVIGGTTANVINIGYYSASSGANSIVINSSGSQANPSTANAFGIYMTSNTSADFEVVGGGESTLNTSFKITGQAYTELHTGTTPVDPNWNNGNIQESTLVAGSSDFDPTNPKAGATYILKLTQPATADGTVNWDNIGAANIKWPGGTEPTLTASAAAVDIITLICTDATGQGVYYASATLNMQ